MVKNNGSNNSSNQDQQRQEETRRVWSDELRAELVAMREILQATITASITEMGEMLVTRLGEREEAREEQRRNHRAGDEEDEHHRRVHHHHNQEHQQQHGVLEMSAAKDDNFPNSETVPSSLPGIQSILRVAKCFHRNCPRIAYLCVWAAHEESTRVNPLSRGTGVSGFKFRLRHWMKSKDGKGELLPDDASYMQTFYLLYYQKYIQVSQSLDFVENLDSYDQLKSKCENALVLYKVLELVMKDTQPPPELLEAHSEVNRLSRIYTPYYTCVPRFPIMSRLKKA